VIRELQQAPCILVQCLHCHHRVIAGLEGLAICHPTAQRFWRHHPRLQTVPGRFIAFQGRSAYITSFVSKNDNAQLDVLSDSETLVVLHTQESAAHV
jgi:hypothetical protein